MSNIQLYQQNTSISIPTRDSEMQLALATPLIKDLSNKVLFDLLKDQITKSYIIARFTSPEANELTLITDETMKVFKSRLGSIRRDEIAILFTRGLSKDYGDYKGLSFITFVDWAKAYLKEDSRIKLTTPVELKQEPTPEQKFSIALSNTINAYQDFKEQKDISLVASTIYRFLVRLKCLKYTDEEKEDFISDATINVNNSLLSQKSTTMDKYKRLEIVRVLEDSQKLEQKIIIEAQRLGLYCYFGGLDTDEITVEQLIKLINEKKADYLKPRM